MGKKTQNKVSESSNKQKKETIQSKKKLKQARPRAEEHLEHIPYRLREIMKSKEKMKMGSSQVKKTMRAAKSAPKEQVDDQEDIPVPHFRRGKKESESAYLGRMNRETQHVLFLTKNQIDRRPELHMQEGEAKEHKAKTEKKKKFDQGRLQRLHKKKLKKREERAEKEMFVDEIQFGEVAMAPPSLTSKPRKATMKTEGASKGLILSSLLGHTAVSTSKPSMARQRIMEEERERVVQAYRHLKKQKQEQQERQRTGLKRLQPLQ